MEIVVDRQSTFSVWIINVSNYDAISGDIFWNNNKKTIKLFSINQNKRERA